MGEGEGQEPGSLGREGGAVGSTDLATGPDPGEAAEPGDSQLSPEEGAQGGSTEQRRGCAEPGANGQELQGEESPP